MDALLVIDVQNDFCADGALAVPDGDAVVPQANRLAAAFGCVVLTQDWHPAGHRSFASVHDGHAPFDTVEAAYGPQVLWPDHCVQGTPGAAFHPDLDVPRAQLVLRKGFRPAVDSYSAFYENDHVTPTGLAGYLRARGVEALYLCGLATDFCVKWSALDGRKEGFAVHVVRDAVRGIDQDGAVAAAWEEMDAAGVHVVTADELLRDREGPSDGDETKEGRA